MNHRHQRWYSPSLGRPMDVAVFGDRGRPLLLFPTAGGDYLEADRMGLIDAVAEQLHEGLVRIYCCGSISGEGWLARDAHPAHKTWMQDRFDAYVAQELVPFIRHEGGDPQLRLIAAGASLGAYNAVNIHLRHPDLFWLSIGMSGTYDFDRWMEGHRSELYYYHQPFQFLPNFPEGEQLSWLRRSFLHIASGRGRWEAPAESVRLGQLLGAKGIPNYIDLWGEDVDHDWPTWRTMLPVILRKRLTSP